MTAAMKVQGAYLQCFLVLSAAAGAAQPVAGQALYTERLGNGTELVVVAQPLADATTVVWPSTVTDGGPSTIASSGDLTLVATLESALAHDENVSAPPVVVAVGGGSVADLRALLERMLTDRPPRRARAVDAEMMVEGRLERRLGAAGSEAEIRLEVNLPPPSDPMRSAVEVLWDLLPRVLAGNLAGARSRVDGDRAIFEARTESSSADLAVRELRLGLARFAENPAVRSAAVESAARRLRVRRQAQLEDHPQSAKQILDLWLAGGTSAVREFLFGIDGVTPEAVRAAASNWLPQHPGNVVLTLPPRSFGARFASPPVMMQLDNGLSAAVLERSGLPLSTMCLRPVVVPDLDDDLAATVLARVARELRELEQPPGWVRVDARPPQIQLAAPADQFSELSEVLHAALTEVGKDSRPVIAVGGGARHRALRLMAATLGIAEGNTLSPATLLRTGNLSLGVVAEDGEAASEAVRKFWAVGGSSIDGTTARTVVPVPKTREAAAGSDSVMVFSLELAAATDETLVLVVADLLASRAETLLDDGTVEILQPFVPGHRVLLVVASAPTTIDVVEEMVREGWAGFTGPTTEEELAGIRRHVAAATAAEWSGATGRARRCAAVASGAVSWRTATDLGMTALSVPTEVVASTLQSIADFDSVPNTGAGLLPIIELGDR